MNADAIPRLPYMSLDHLVAHPPNQGLAYLMRHAERGPLAGPETILFADLTENGWDAARRFGRELTEKYQICGVYCSPVNRCLNTGTAILQGANSSMSPQSRWWLFSPFLKGKNQNGRAEIKISSTSTPDMGVASLDCSSLRTVVERIKIPPRPGAINLYIAHDSTVTPTTGYLMGLDTVWVNQYPKYLEGIVLVRDDAGRTIIYNP